jgi:hypothetical protein
VNFQKALKRLIVTDADPIVPVTEGCKARVPFLCFIPIVAVPKANVNDYSDKINQQKERQSN